MITWSRFAGMKFHPVQLGQILPYYYMWKLNFVPARWDCFPPDNCLDLYTISLNISLSPCQFTKLKVYWFPFDLIFFALVISILVHKIRSSRSQIFFRMVFFKVSQYSQENISVSASQKSGTQDPKVRPGTQDS